MKKISCEDIRTLLKSRSPSRGLAFALLFAVTAILVMSFGLFRVLFIYLMGLIGYLIGAGRLKKEVTEGLNKVIPATKKVVYTHDDLDKVADKIKRPEAAEANEPTENQ